jgi:hypothetical protein
MINIVAGLQPAAREGEGGRGREGGREDEEARP